MFVKNIENMEIIKNFINEMIDELQDKSSEISKLEQENFELKKALENALTSLQKDKAIEEHKNLMLEQQAISLDELQKENERLKKQIEGLKEKPIIIDPTVYFNYLYSNGQGGFSGYIEKLDNDDAESCHLKLIWERENKK